MKKFKVSFFLLSKPLSVEVEADDEISAKIKVYNAISFFKVEQIVNAEPEALPCCPSHTDVLRLHWYKTEIAKVQAKLEHPAEPLGIHQQFNLYKELLQLNQSLAVFEKTMSLKTPLYGDKHTDPLRQTNL